MGRKDVAQRTVLPTGNHHGKIFLSRGDHPAVLGVNLVVPLQSAASDGLIKPFMRKMA